MVSISELLQLELLAILAFRLIMGEGGGGFDGCDDFIQIMFYTKYHLKFKKNQAENLDILDFGVDFFFILLVFSIITCLAIIAAA